MNLLVDLILATPVGSADIEHCIRLHCLDTHLDPDDVMDGIHDHISRLLANAVFPN